MNEGEDKEAFLLIFVLYKIGSGGLGRGEGGEWNDRLFEKIWWSRGQQLCKLLGIKESFNM